MRKDAFYSSLETMDFGKSFMRQGILLGQSLCDRVQGVMRLATHLFIYYFQFIYRWI